MRSITSTRGRAELPVHLGHQQQIETGEVAAQLAAVGRLAHQVEFVVQVFVEFGDHLARLQALAVGPQTFGPDGDVAQQCEVGVDHRQHVRAQHLHRDGLARVLPGLHLREVHLRDRRARHRHPFEIVEQHVDRRAERLFDEADRHRRMERRHLVLQLGQFVGDIDRQQIAPRGQHLAELDEDRPEAFEREAQTHARRRVELAADGGDTQQQPHATVVDAAEHHLIETEADDREKNLEETQKTHS